LSSALVSELESASKVALISWAIIGHSVYK
jgi:hypothetical protein